MTDQKTPDGPQERLEGGSATPAPPEELNGPQKGAEGLGTQQQPRGPVDWARHYAADRETQAAAHRGPHRMTNFEAILIGLLSATHTREQAEHAARTVLRDHAHQLAEQQRAKAYEVASNDSELSCVHATADLIDPEVQP